jgi:hypothetical protein
MQPIIIGLLASNILCSFTTYYVVKQIQMDTININCELKKINENSVYNNNLLKTILNKKN